VAANGGRLHLPHAVTRLAPRTRSAAARVTQSAPQASAAATANALGPVTANIQVTYHDFPANAQSAFQAAVDIWKTKVMSSAPILIDATWTDLTTQFGDSGILASSGPTDFVANFSDAPQQNVFYPVAQANAISGTDQEPPSSGNSDGSEIETEFNSAPSAPWYFGTDAHPGSSQEDLETVVLHEVAHGLGFLGSLDGIDESTGRDVGQGYWGLTGDGQNPTIFDKFATDSKGTPLLSYPSGSTALGKVLRGGTFGAKWGGAWGIRAVGGPRPSLYSPSTWQPGSSFSHLDEATYPAGSANALMTPGVTPGETDHDPGALLLGMFRDIGWPTPCTTTVPAGSPTDTFHPVTPTRIYSATAYQGRPLDIPVTGLAGVPLPGVHAVAVNIEVYRPNATGYTQVLPGCTAFNKNNPSSQEYSTGQTRSELAVVRVNREGGIRFWLADGQAFVNVDLAGYFSSASGGDRFHQLPPGWLKVGGTTVKAGVPLDEQVLGVGGIPSTGVDAVVLKADVTKSTAAGWLIVSPGGVNTATGTQAFPASARISNLVMVRPGTGAFAGKVRARITAGTANVAYEVVGWYGSPNATSGLVFHPGSGPVRLLSGVRTSETLVSGFAPSTSAVLSAAANLPSGNGWLGNAPAGGTVLRGTQEYSTNNSISGLTITNTSSAGQVRLHPSVGVATLYADWEGTFAAS
jgi:hypothetical protein